MSARIATRPGHYVIGEELTSGGTAMLFRGRLCGSGGWTRPVIIKRLLPPFLDAPEYIELIRNEAKLYSQLAHPNILQIYDYVELDNSPCLVLEPVDGIDLQKLLHTTEQRKHTLSLAAILFIFYELSQALFYLHQRLKKREGVSIIHRDLSPDNVLVTLEGHIKLADFGIALEKSATTPVREKIIWAKPAYCSPEQAAGKVVDERSDIYSLGMLMSEIAKRSGHPSWNTGNETRLSALLSRCIQAEPDKRYPDCGELSQDLMKLGSGSFAAGNQELKELLGLLYPHGLPRVKEPKEATRKFNVTRVVSRKRPALSTVTVSAAVVALGLVFFLPTKTVVERYILPEGKKPEPPQALPVSTEKSAIATPRPTVKPKPAKGSLKLTSNPWSYVYINGKKYGRTPIKRLSLPVGTYRISFRSPLYPLVRERTVKVIANRRINVHEIFGSQDQQKGNPF